ncbi:MAG: PorV/PorQ family protein [Elusimicrobia bacterium]|nr:PorV/PorQ family protein [Elusimicrobiota bacterium]
MRKFITTIAFFTLLIYKCYAAGPWTNGADILTRGVGARPLGMGEAFVGLADDINTLQFNPAGLSNISCKELGAIYSKELVDTGYSNITYSQPLKNRGYIGGSFLLFQGGDIEINWWDAVNGVRTETRNAEQDYVLTFGYARNLMSDGELSIGANLKYISSKLAEESTASSIAVDLGFLTRLSAYPLSVGLSIQNLGTALKYKGGIASGSESDPLPMAIRVGGAYKFISEDMKKLTGVLDINKYTNTDMQINLGLECWLKEMITLRAGYKTGNDLASITAGVGFRFKSSQLDYGFSPMSEINAVHKISFVLRFGESSGSLDKKTEDTAAEQHYQRGLIYFNAEKYELAIQEFRDALATDPNHKKSIIKLKEATEKPIEQTFLRGLEYFDKGQYDNAKVQLGKVLEMDPSHKKAQQKLKEITLLERARQTEEALRNAEEKLKETSVTVPKKLPIEPAPAETENTLKNTILFELNSSSITPSGLRIIDNVAKTLSVFPLQKVSIEGHSDINEANSEEISRKRAEIVRDFLIKEYNISPERINMTTFGTSKPVADSSDADGQTKNRRVEITIVE